MMHALITGGAGFIGSHLARVLLDRGDAVTVIDDLSTGRLENVESLTAHPRFRLAVETVANGMVLDRLVSEATIVFHLAAAVGVDLVVRDPIHVIEANVLGTHAVLRAAGRYRRKVLLASTSEIYGKGTQVPFQEDDDRVMGPTTRSRWSYAASKAVDEFLALAYHRQQGLPVVIFRLFNTIGARQTGRYGMVVPRFVRAALLGEPLPVYGDGRQSRCFCNVRDVVRAIVGLAESPHAVGEVFNVGSGDELTILELARKVLDVVGGSPGAGGMRFVPYDEAYAPGFEDMLRRVPDISKIKRVLAWEPRISLRETLCEVAEAIREEETSRQVGLAAH